VVCHWRDFGAGCFHRQQHVGAGVAIRHREDVKGVDGLGVALKPGCSSAKEALEGLAVTAVPIRRTPGRPGLPGPLGFHRRQGFPHQS